MNEREPTTRLERLLVAAATDPAERPAFSRALLASDIYVLGTVDRPLADGVATSGTNVRILSLADDEGPLTPFFTSEAIVEHTIAVRPGTDPRFLRLPCRAFFEMTSGSRLVLNPDAEFGKHYPPAEVDALLKGQEPGVETQVIQESTQVFVGEPAHMPTALPEVLARFLAQRPMVERAHLGWIAYPDGHTGYLMVVVSDDPDGAMDGFGSVQIGDVTDGHSLDVLHAATDADNHLLSGIPPFYTRSTQSDVPPKPQRRRFRRS